MITPKEFYATGADAGLWLIPRHKCLELLACLHVFGNADSQWTMGAVAHKCLFAGKMLRFAGGQRPEAADVVAYQRLLRELLPRGDGGAPASPLPEWARRTLAENGVRIPTPLKTNFAAPAVPPQKPLTSNDHTGAAGVALPFIQS